MIELTFYIYWFHKYNYLVDVPFLMKYIVLLDMCRVLIHLQFILLILLIGREDKLGLQLRKRKCRRVPPITVIDMDFPDDIALVSECIKEAQEMVTRVEKSAKRVRLSMNTGTRNT